MSNDSDKTASPIANLFDRMRDIIRPRGADDILRDTIEEIIEEGAQPTEEISAPERALLRNIFKLRQLTAYDVMVPRADIVAVRHDISLADLVKLMTRDAHSRMPVFRESLDDVAGMVHIKDVLQFWGGDRSFKLDDILRKVLFVAPSMHVLDLLLEMRKQRVHMALVVDEYGGIDGLVTIEDVVEEIVGEIEDEHDVDEGPHLVTLVDGSHVADARLPIAEFEAKVGPILTEDQRGSDIDTLGGLVVTQAGRLPARGEVIQHPSGFEFEVLEADPRRLKRLKVRRLPESASDG
jgi:CBS domain containing-hemolysin-like protein